MKQRKMKIISSYDSIDTRASLNSSMAIINIDFMHKVMRLVGRASSGWCIVLLASSIFDFSFCLSWKAFFAHNFHMLEWVEKKLLQTYRWWRSREKALNFSFVSTRAFSSELNSLEASPARDSQNSLTAGFHRVYFVFTRNSRVNATRHPPTHIKNRFSSSFLVDFPMKGNFFARDSYANLICLLSERKVSRSLEMNIPGPGNGFDLLFVMFSFGSFAPFPSLWKKMSRSILSSKWLQSGKLSHLKMNILTSRDNFSFFFFLFHLQARRRNVTYAQSIHHRAIWARRRRPARMESMERQRAHLALSPHYVSFWFFFHSFLKAWIEVWRSSSQKFLI